MTTKTEAFYDALAESHGKWLRRNRHYHKMLAKLLAFHVRPGCRVLEIGCATGGLLAAMKPSRGVGVDLSAKMLDIARREHPELTFVQAAGESFHLDEQFDYILIADTVGLFEDVQAVFKTLRHVCHDGTRILLTNYSFLWRQPIELAAKLKLKMPEPEPSWLTPSDLDNLLRLEDFEVVKSTSKLLLPLNLPPLSWLCDKYLANLPGFSALNLVNLLVARPLRLRPPQEPSVSIVIPARNEAGNIRRALLEMPRFAPDIEVIFVEGGSTDDTWEQIEQAAAEFPQWKIKYARQEGKGKGDAVRKGFAMASGDILMILDADLTVPPAELPKFHAALVSGKGEFINGCRLVYPVEDGAMRMLNTLGNKGFGLIFTWLLGQRFKDTLCGTKVLTKDDYLKIAAGRDYFGNFDPFGDFDLLFGATKLDLKITDIPIRYKRREYGDTNISRFRHGWILLKMCCFAMRKIKFV